MKPHILTMFQDFGSSKNFKNWIPRSSRGMTRVPSPRDLIAGSRKSSILNLIEYMMGILPLTICLYSTLAAQEISQPTEFNPGFEQRLHSLVENLRCPVCQNESLASSRAPLAQDLRKTVQTQMEQGKSDQEILAFLKERYGDFIDYQPPLNSTTLLLWFGPFVLLVAGGLGLFFYLKRTTTVKKQ